MLATLLSLQARGLSSCCRGRICLLLQLQILACRHGGFLLFRDSNKHDCSGTRGPDMSVARPRSPDGSSDARISHVKTSDVTNFRDVSSLCPAGAHCRRCIEKHGSADVPGHMSRIQNMLHAQSTLLSGQTGGEKVQQMQVHQERCLLVPSSYVDEAAPPSLPGCF